MPCVKSLALLACAIALSRAGTGPRRISGRLQVHRRRRQEGRQGRRVLDHRRQAGHAAHQGLRGRVSRREGRVHRPELDRGLQPLHQRKRCQRDVGRRGVELVDGPADEACRRRPGDDLQVAGDRGAAGLGALEGQRLRDHVRADRDRLQQAARSARGRSEDARRPDQAPDQQGRQVPEKGHDLRRREIRRRLHAGQPGCEAQSRFLGPGGGDGRARRRTCRARPAR